LSRLPGYRVLHYRLNYKFLSETKTINPIYAIPLRITRGNNIAISATPESSIEFEADGQSSFNGSKLLQERKLFLNYKYEREGYTYHCQDTLSFRNRIRDGVNEWQDENPENYK
jgi:hypothetical protein